MYSVYALTDPDLLSWNQWLRQVTTAQLLEYLQYAMLLIHLRSFGNTLWTMLKHAQTVTPYSHTLPILKFMK